jgi:hypothetical protein
LFSPSLPEEITGFDTGLFGFYCFWKGFLIDGGFLAEPPIWWVDLRTGLVSLDLWLEAELNTFFLCLLGLLGESA